MSNWYILYLRSFDEDGQPLPMTFPLVGSTICHKLGQSEDQEKNDKDKENPLFKLFQPEARPAWSPDFLTMGYAIVFKREGLPKLAVKLGIRNPENLKKEAQTPTSTGKRILTFDDAWVAGVTPLHHPLGMPSTKLPPEEWWLSVSQVVGLASPYISAGGAQVVVGAQRLSDVVTSMLNTKEGFPRVVPGLDDVQPDALTEFRNPRLPILPVVRNEPDQPGHGGQLDKYAASPVYRY